MELFPQMRALPKGAAAALLFLALAVLAGCGGGGGSDTPTKAAFIKRADAICKQADDEQTKALEEAAKKGSLGKLSSAEQLNLAVKLGLPPIQKEAGELGELTPPSGDESEVKAFVEAIEEAAKKAEADPSLLSGNAGAFNKADQMGESYGFEDCAESS
jgi:hypothetical protein